ncbi:unnamed protein product [Ectocarpus sp. CCAP 1310/34]|nr:unnamed protein product [Ectocarpus sp. CCAP 1310/34]
MKNKGNAKKADRTAERRGAAAAAAASTRTAGSGGQQADRANGRGSREAKPGQAVRGNGKGRKAKDEGAVAMEERDQDSSEELSNGSSSEEVDDEDGSEDGEEGDDDGSDDDDDNDNDDSGEESEEFEDQGSDSDDSEEMERQQAEAEEDSDDDEGKGGGSGKVKLDESTRQTWSMGSRDAEIKAQKGDGALAVSMAMHTDDLSSDDDEENRNTVGRVPLHWYDEYDHIGYDRSGGKVMKRADGTGNGIDAALSARDDPNYARTVYDAYNDREVTLTDRELEVIRRIQAGAFPHPEFQAYPDYVDYFTHEKQVMPLEGGDEPKRRFIPSKWEMMKVHQLMKGIREGRIVVNPKKKVEEDSYAIWKDDDDIPEKHRGPMHIPAPKIPLPGHAESYRPPKEYLLTEEEQKQWEEMDPSERPTNFIPKSFDSLREVGAYGGFVKERFERCLDLYLCPRAFKRRLNIDPESLVPRLPRPRELKPFPNALCVEYKGHAASVRCIACSGDGQWMATGDDSGVLIVWEVDTARAAQRFDLSGYGGIGAMEWNPNPDHHVLAVGAGKSVVLIATGTGGPDASAITEALLQAAGNGPRVKVAAPKGGGEEAAEQQPPEESAPDQSDDDDSEGVVGKKGPPVKWEALVAATVKGKGSRRAAGAEGSDGEVGPRVVLRCEREICCVTWHGKGDYLASVSRGEDRRAVMIHQVSKASTQCPFRKTKGEVQCVKFHVSKPFLFVATKQQVRIYHLIKQMLVKKLISGCKWISCIDVHPTGDHLIVGSYDRRVAWFDLDLASTPYKTLKYHTKAVRAAQFHRHYPLMASAGDDGSVHVFHATVYSDLLRNPLVVPLKILRGHEVTGGLGVMALAFHPRQPWVFTAGADGAVRLFQDV